MRTDLIEGKTLETWTVDEVAAAYEKGEIALIDVRTPQEYMLEHVDGALLFPLPFFAARSLPSQEGKRLVFYCGSGKRSEKAAHKALAGGLSPVAHMEGGFGAWKQAGKAYMGTDMATGAPQKVEAKG